MSCVTDGAFQSAGPTSAAFAAAGIQDAVWDSCWGIGTMIYKLIEVLGGARNIFAAAPAVSDSYPAGSTDDKLVPGSNRFLGDSSRLPGTYVLEAEARASAAGGRVKIGLFDLTNDPNTVIAGSEITFSADQTVGERARSSGFAMPDGVVGAKMTINSTSLQPAGWGVRILKVS